MINLNVGPPTAVVNVVALLLIRPGRFDTPDRVAHLEPIMDRLMINPSRRQQDRSDIKES